MHPIRFSEREIEFNKYIESLFSSGSKSFFWNEVKKLSNAYIFGGVIKDFFLDNKNNHRDIDIVIEGSTDSFRNSIKEFIIRQNQFGGLKLQVGDLSVDLWELNKTWAIIKEKTKKNEQKKQLPSTSFFNVTAVTYSIRESSFIYDKSFIEFLDSKTLDIVYERNPYPELCIVKSYDFHKKYSLELSNKLKEYIKKYFISTKDNLESIQRRHFGKVVYPLTEIEDFYLSMDLVSEGIKEYE